MKRYVGTLAFGVRTPIIKEGDDLVSMVADSVISALYSKELSMQNKDIVCVTESLLARAQGNYCSTLDITEDIIEKFPDEFGVVFPILSRNRFAPILKGLAESGRKLHILLAYPSDEVGNHLMEEKLLYGKQINPYSDVLSEEEYRLEFGDEVKHTFTGIDYVQLYKDIAPNSEIYFANDSRAILNYTKDVLVCSVHNRERVSKELKDAGAHRVYGLDDILTHSRNGSGYNPEYGLLGANAAGGDRLKLFPREGQSFVEALSHRLSQASGKQIEAMVYGDGAFKDPIGQIWELADPVVSPAHTSGLAGTPNEIKMKYIADTEFKNLSAEEMEIEMTKRISAKDETGFDEEDAIGTTPRRITDLIGSLADLTSGSGDKGTPVVYIQGYFDNFASE